ncbi:MAG: hypothetical protein RLZZ502_1481 [Pseudomonadota bacterium]|jgi:cell division protein FtsN
MKAQNGNTVLGILIGLGLGLLIAALVAYFTLKGNSGFRKPEVQAPLLAIPSAPASPPAASQTAGAAPAELAGNPTIISPSAASASAPTLAPALPASVAPVAQTPSTSAAGADAGNFFIQIGAYANREEAENQRARLALLGQEGKISTVEREGKTLYRLRLGPYARSDEAGSARAELAKNGLEANLVKN